MTSPILHDIPNASPMTLTLSLMCGNKRASLDVVDDKGSHVLFVRLAAETSNRAAARVMQVLAEHVQWMQQEAGR